MGVLNDNTIIGASAAGAAPVTVSYTALGVFSGDASQPFAGTAIGTAAANRHVVLVIGTGGNITISSATVGGVSAAEIVKAEGGDNMRTHIYIAAVPTGTTADVVVTQSGTSNGGVGVWAMYGASATAHDTLTSTSTSNPVTGTIDIAENGAAIGGIYANRYLLPTYVWTGLTEKYDQQSHVAVYALSGASDAFSSEETGRTISIACLTSNTGMAVASFEQA